jgi:hypothetical protein
MKYDLEFDVDPLFNNTTAKFNETGTRGLLLNNLPIDDKLDALLESKTNKDEKISIKMTGELNAIISGKKFLKKYYKNWTENCES